MTPEDLERLSLGYRSLVAKLLLDWLGGIVRDGCVQLPAEQRAATLTRFREKVEDMRETLSEMTLPGVHPAESDMETAMLREHFDELAGQVLSMIAGSRN